MAPLPSWIQGESSQFSDAYAAGARVGLSLAKERLEDARKRREEPNVTVEQKDLTGTGPDVRRSGPESVMRPFLPQPAAPQEPASQGPSLLQRFKNLVAPIGRWPDATPALG